MGNHVLRACSSTTKTTWYMIERSASGVGGLPPDMALPVDRPAWTIRNGVTISEDEDAAARGRRET